MGGYARALSLRESEKTSQGGQQFRMTLRVSSRSNSITQRHTGGDGSGLSREREITYRVFFFFFNFILFLDFT